jgi:hypothetical protein
VRRVVTSLAVVLLATACGGSGERADRVEPASFEAEGVVAERVLVGPSGRAESIAATESTVLVLVSTRSVGSADTVLRSVDDGRTWESVAGPFGPMTGSPSTDWVLTPNTPRLIDAGGDVVVATRPSKGPSAELLQDVAVSADGGVSWRPVAVEGPDGRLPVVNDAIVDHGELVLVGLTAASPTGGLAPPGGPADAAVWRGPVDAASFLFAADPLGVDEGTQVLTDVAATSTGLVVLGGDCRRSSNGGCCVTRTGLVSFRRGDRNSWAALGGLEDPNDPAFVPLQQEGDLLALGLTFGRYVLEPGADEWTVEPIPGALDDVTRSEIGQGVWVRDGDAHLVTMNADSACDCSVAKAGRVDADAGLGDLGFSGCDDTSVRGATRVGAPHVVAGTGLADAACFDRGRYAGAFAVTHDHGGSWATALLNPLVPDGFDQILVEHRSDRSVATGDAVITTGNAGRRPSKDDESGMSNDLPLGPVVVVRLTPR